MNIENEILAKYGSNVYVALGTVADEITAKYQAAWDNGVYTDNALPGQAMMNQLWPHPGSCGYLGRLNELKKASLNLWMSESAGSRWSQHCVCCLRSPADVP